MRLDLSEGLTTGRCLNVNLRAETHGDQKVMAMDFDITFDAPNTILDAFHPELRTALYFSTADDMGQELVEGVDAILPNFRFAHLTLPLKWEGQLTGYALEFDHGLGDEASNIQLEGCKVGKFRITPREGGSVNVAMQVQASTEQLTTDDKGLLSDLPAKPTIQFRLTPPEILPEEVEQEQPKDTRQTPAEALAAQLGFVED